MWKRVQEKLPTDGSKSNYSGSSPPKNLGNQKQMKALKDITNGKTVTVNGLMKLGPANCKTSKSSLPSRRKTPIVHETTTPPQFPTLSSLINDVQANLVQCIVPALFGHSPPKILHDDDSSQFMDASSNDLSSNGQVRRGQRRRRGFAASCVVASKGQRGGRRRSSSMGWRTAAASGWAQSKGRWQ
ncbi:hypothetical protein M0R45_019371 [Rubus argutus]|uniref:Uncharacterized protein n=1 Tax=Rubus argutus TaxID=59490 RepID=A0AAW1X5W1_RUBAR